LALSRQEREAEVSPEVETAIERALGGGQALDTRVRVQMESAFDADFSSVRVHTDAEAHSLNQVVNAVAFTTGKDIFFRQSAYDPDSSAGRELLAHELTHVVQQSGGPKLQGKLVLGEAGDPFEQEADRVARQVVAAMKDPGAWQSHSSNDIGSGSVQRQCACGGHTASGGECEECRQKREVTVERHVISLQRQDDDADGGMPDSGIPDASSDSGQQTASDGLSNLVANVEMALNSAMQTVAAKQNEAPGTPEVAEAQDDLSRVSTQIQNLKKIAAGADEGKKQYALSLLAPGNISQAEQAIAEARNQPVSMESDNQGSQPLARAATSTGVSDPLDRAEIQAAQIAHSVLANGPLSRSASRTSRILRQPAPVVTPTPSPPPLTVVPQPPPVVPPPAAVPWWLELLEGIGGAVLLILTLGALLPGDTPLPQAQPQPQPQPDDPRRKCLETHPNAIICDEFIDRDEVVVRFLMSQGVSFDSLGDCSRFSSFGAGTIDACGGAPGEDWHCSVKGTSDVVSVFGCLCCNADGSTGLDWRDPHWSGK
jgi:hypothetical protein